MKCAILAVGNEILLGDVLNSNAHSLSKSLSLLGFQVQLHLAVKDSTQDILDALEFAKVRAEILFVTGGLGPTSDDFTRTVISQWTECPLAFDEPSWRYIENLFSERNYPMHQFQRQQCYFPVGSQILMNSQGTAPGFQMKHNDLEIIVLPGPPREIAAIWSDHLIHDFQARIPLQKRMSTRSWFCLGPGESQVAAEVEPLLKKSAMVYGYRTFFPYIEVRLEGLESELAQKQSLCDELLKTMNELGPVYSTAEPIGLLNSWLDQQQIELVIEDDTNHRLLHQAFLKKKTPSPPRSEIVVSLSKNLMGQYVARSLWRDQFREHQLAGSSRRIGALNSEKLALEQALWFWLLQWSGQSFRML